MSDIILKLLSVSLSGTFIALIIGIMLRLLKGRVSQTWSYYIWLIVLVRLIVPFTPSESLIGNLFDGFAPAATTVNMTDEKAAGVLPDLTNENLSATGDMSASKTDEMSADYTGSVDTGRQVSSFMQKSLDEYLILGYIFIVLLLIVQKMTRYNSFMKFIRAGSMPLTDVAILDSYHRCCDAAGITRLPVVYTNQVVVSPMLAGICKPVLVFPAKQFDSQQWEFIFRHELIHYKRRDILYKWLAQAVLCVHWFNPAVYAVVKAINKSCELSCDEAVIRNLGAADMRAYGDTLIAAIKHDGAYHENVAVAALNESARDLKERLGAIMKFKPCGKYAFVLSLILTVVLSSGAVYAGAYRAKALLPAVGNSGNMATGVERYDSNGNNSTVRGIYSDQYIIFFRITNDNSLAEGEPMTVRFNDNTQEVYFTAATKGFASSSEVLKAIYHAMATGNITSRWHNDTITDWFYYVEEISGPYTESRETLADRFYQQDDIRNFSAVIAGLNEDGNGSKAESLAEQFYNDRRVDYFSVIAAELSSSKKSAFLQRADQDNRVDFFAVLMDDQEEQMNWDESGERYYQEKRIDFFTVVMDAMSNTKRMELFDRSYQDKQIEFFAVLMDYSDESTLAEYAERAYQDNNISFFSVVIYELPDETGAAYRERAQRDGKLSFYAMLGY